MNDRQIFHSVGDLPIDTCALDKWNSKNVIYRINLHQLGAGGNPYFNYLKSVNISKLEPVSHNAYL